ncbi:MAG: nuclear transport factor 2 family protein [Chitinophagaceae bacterium]|nr:nuclear transport factor 2 family protein [Chitinophagaceae bacterium]
MKKFQFLAIAVIVMSIGWSVVNAQPAAGTNSKFTIASDEYSEISEKAINYLTSFNFDAWAEMLADDVVYMFPDGDVDTRTTLKGKQAVLDWWRNWQKTSGIKTMTVSEFNHVPFNVTEQLKGGALPGTYNISYFSSRQEYGKATVSLRMNFVMHFNAEKKIDRYFTYYDRSKIIQAAGANALKK